MQTTLWIALFLTASQQPARFPWKMEQKAAGSFEATLNWTLKNPGFEAVEWVAIAAKPPDLSCQKVHSVKLLPGVSEEITEESPLKRAFLRNRIPANKENKEPFLDSLKAVLTMQVSLTGRKIVPASPRGAPAGHAPETLTVPQRKKYLRPSVTVDFDADDFKRWMKEEKIQRKSGEDDWTLARRFFLLIRSRYQFRPDPKVLGKASTTAIKGEGDYGAINALFVALCRSQGIPSRTLVGRLAKSTQLVTPRGGGAALSNHQWCIRAEWWHPDLGWVPVDLMSNLGQDRTEPQSNKWFGADTGDMIVFHEDFDVTLDPVLFEKKDLVGMEGIAVWSMGKGKLDAQTLTENWNVKKIPKPKEKAIPKPDSKK